MACCRRQRHCRSSQFVAMFVLVVSVETTACQHPKPAFLCVVMLQDRFPPFEKQTSAEGQKLNAKKKRSLRGHIISFTSVR